MQQNEFHFRAYRPFWGAALLALAISLMFAWFWWSDHFGPLWVKNAFCQFGVPFLIFFILAKLFTRRASTPVRATFSQAGLDFTVEKSFWTRGVPDGFLSWGEIAWWQYDNQSDLGHGDALADVFRLGLAQGGQWRFFIHEGVFEKSPFFAFLAQFRVEVAAQNAKNPAHPIRERSYAFGKILKFSALFLLSTCLFLTISWIGLHDFAFIMKKPLVMVSAWFLFGFGAFKSFQQLKIYWEER